MLEIDKYEIEITLTEDMLGTNPLDPQVHDTHILDRQRKLIAENKDINKEVNKYLKAMEISSGVGEIERNGILDKLEKIIGREFSNEERELAIKGELESLKESFEELDIRGITVFFWDKDKQRPAIGSHMILGFLKAAAEAIGRTMEKKKGAALGSISYTQSLINQHVRIEGQLITFDKDIKRDGQGKPIYLQRSLRAKTAQGPRISLAKSEIVEAGAKLRFKMKVLGGSELTERVLRTLFDYGSFTGLGQWRSSGRGALTYEMIKL